MKKLSPPNPRLQRTRAAVPPQTARGETSSLGGARRAPLSHKPLGSAREGGADVLSPMR